MKERKSMKLVFQPDNSYQCGQACVAMLADKTLTSIIRAIIISRGIENLIREAIPFDIPLAVK